MAAQEFRERLRAVVRRKYKNNMTDASRAIGQNINYVGRVLNGSTEYPGIDVLQRMAKVYGWSLHDAVDWILGMPTAEPDLAPEEEARRGLERLGLDSETAEHLIQLAKGLVMRDARADPHEGETPPGPASNVC